MLVEFLALFVQCERPNNQADLEQHSPDGVGTDLSGRDGGKLSEEANDSSVAVE